MEVRSKDTSKQGREQQTTATFIHLSTFLKYFFPFANFIAPVLIWALNKEKPFVDEHGRQAINFQLSLLVYTLILGLGCLAFAIVFGADFIHLIDSLDRQSENLSAAHFFSFSGYLIVFGVALTLYLGLFVFQIFAVINASIHASKGLFYKYPLCISFLKSTRI